MSPDKPPTWVVCAVGAMALVQAAAALGAAQGFPLR